MKEVEKFEFNLWQFNNYPKELEYVELFSLDKFPCRSLLKDFTDSGQVGTKAPRVFIEAYNEGVLDDKLLKKRKDISRDCKNLPIKKNGCFDKEAYEKRRKEYHSVMPLIGLKHRFTLDEYLKNEDIKYYLKYFELDTEKFWYLLLFFYECTDEMCFDGEGDSLGHKCDTLEEFNRMIDSNVHWDEFLMSIETGDFYQTKDHMSLTLKIGKETLTIKTPAIIEYIRLQTSLPKDTEDNSGLIYSTSMISSYMDRKWLTEPKKATIVYFARLLFDFFNLQEQIVKKRYRNTEGEFSDDEYDFISKLVCFTNVSKSSKENVAYKKNTEALRQALYRAKEHKYKNFSRYDRRWID